MEMMGWVVAVLALIWAAGKSSHKPEKKTLDHGRSVKLTNLSEHYRKMGLNPLFRGVELKGLFVTLTSEEWDAKTPILVPLENRPVIIFVDESEIEQV